MVQILKNSSSDGFAALDDILTSTNKGTEVPSDNCKTVSIKIGDINVNVRSYFHSEKSLYNALFTIVSSRLKEKSA